MKLLGGKLLSGEVQRGGGKMGPVGRKGDCRGKQKGRRKSWDLQTYGALPRVRSGKEKNLSSP